MRPNQKLKRPCGVFVFGSWPRFATRNQRLLVRKQVDLTSTAQSNRHGFPAAGVITPCEGIRAPQPPFASVTMRWQAGAEQLTRRRVPQPYFALRPDLKSLYYPTNPSVCIFHNFLYAPFARNNCLCVPVSTIFPF